jgi:hypothetical protein
MESAIATPAKNSDTPTILTAVLIFILLSAYSPLLTDLIQVALNHDWKSKFDPGYPSRRLLKRPAVIDREKLRRLARGGMSDLFTHAVSVGVGPGPLPDRVPVERVLRVHVLLAEVDVLQRIRLFRRLAGTPRLAERTPVLGDGVSGNYQADQANRTARNPPNWFHVVLLRK